MANGSLTRLFWRAFDDLNYWLTQARLWLADTMYGRSARCVIRLTDRRRESAIAAVREHSGLQSERALSDLADYVPIRVILLVIPRKPKPKLDNPEQFKRFIDMVREVEVDELERAFRKVTGRLQKSESLARSDRNRSRRNRDEGGSQR